MQGGLIFMTVEELLKQLEREREYEMANVWLYGSRAQEARIHEDYDEAKEYQQYHDKSDKNAEQLYLIIREIKKRVS
jgi:ABC-type ATPase with predicted acetyltransferase domain